VDDYTKLLIVYHDFKNLAPIYDPLKEDNLVLFLIMQTFKVKILQTRKRLGI
jgi:hypothetical protein